MYLHILLANPYPIIIRPNHLTPSNSFDVNLQPSFAVMFGVRGAQIWDEQILYGSA